MSEQDVIYEIEVFREDDGRYAAEFRSGDDKSGGMGEYSATPVGALANLCATLIKVQEDESKLSAIRSELNAFAVRLAACQQDLPPRSGPHHARQPVGALRVIGRIHERRRTR